MREDGDILLSLVAEIDGEVVGQVTLSEASVGGSEGWIGLGPIAVTPARYHQGIGGAMIRASLDWARERGAAGVVLTGADTYYPRFGFESGEVSYLTTPTRFTMRHVLNGPPASGEIVFCWRAAGSGIMSAHGLRL